MSAPSSVLALIAPSLGNPNNVDIADGVDPLTSSGMSRVPRTMDPLKYNPGVKRGSSPQEESPYEPGGYPGQR